MKNINFWKVDSINFWKKRDIDTGALKKIVSIFITLMIVFNFNSCKSIDILKKPTIEQLNGLECKDFPLKVFNMVGECYVITHPCIVQSEFKPDTSIIQKIENYTYFTPDTINKTDTLIITKVITKTITIRDTIVDGRVLKELQDELSESKYDLYKTNYDYQKQLNEQKKKENKYLLIIVLLILSCVFITYLVYLYHRRY